MKKNLVLTGMMGVGKSTIGRSLSKKLNMRFVDLDRLIEKKESSTIKEIFKQKGEKYFRNLERKIALKKLKQENSIIALGGGAFIDSQIRKEVLKNCISFWLEVKIKVILNRSRNLKKRPLLNRVNLKSTFHDIYERRKKVYSLADFKINCTRISKSKVTGKIIKIYESQ